MSSFLPEKSSGGPAFISLVCSVAILSLGGRGVGSKVSPSSLVILMSRSGTEVGDCSGIVVMVRRRGSSGPGDECHGMIFKSLQGLCILHPVVSSDGLAVPRQ